MEGSPGTGHSLIMEIIEDVISSMSTSSDLCDCSALGSISSNLLASSNTGTLLSLPCTNTLRILLEKKNRSVEEENTIKIMVWWNLVRTFGSKNLSVCSMVINHLLEFCLASCKELKSGKKKKEKNIFERIAFEAIFQILETTKSVDIELENYQWTLEPLPVKVSLDSPHIIAVLLDNFAEFLSSATKDFDVPVTILYKINLKLSQHIKKSDMQVYLKFLKCLKSLVEKKILNEEKLIELTVLSGFIIDEIFYSVIHKNEQMALDSGAVKLVLDIHTKLFSQIKIYENLSLYLGNMTSWLLALFHAPVDIEATVPSFTPQLTRLWQKLCQCVTRIYGSSCRLHDLEILFPLLECAFLYPHRNIRKSAQKLWTSTFSHLPDQSYPESLKVAVTLNAAGTYCVGRENSELASFQNQTSNVPCANNCNINNEIDEISSLLKKFHINKTVKVNLTRLEDDVKLDPSEKTETLAVEPIIAKQEQKQQMIDDCLKKALERIAVYKVEIQIKVLKIH